MVEYYDEGMFKTRGPGEAAVHVKKEKQSVYNDVRVAKVRKNSLFRGFKQLREGTKGELEKRVPHACGKCSVAEVRKTPRTRQRSLKPLDGVSTAEESSLSKDRW
jgi:hypothetical protein